MLQTFRCCQASTLEIPATWFTLPSKKKKEKKMISDFVQMGKDHGSLSHRGEHKQRKEGKWGERPLGSELFILLLMLLDCFDISVMQPTAAIKHKLRSSV